MNRRSIPGYVGNMLKGRRLATHKTLECLPQSLAEKMHLSHASMKANVFAYERGNLYSTTSASGILRNGNIHLSRLGFYIEWLNFPDIELREIVSAIEQYDGRFIYPSLPITGRADRDSRPDNI